MHQHVPMLYSHQRFACDIASKRIIEEFLQMTRADVDLDHRQMTHFFAVPQTRPESLEG